MIILGFLSKRKKNKFINWVSAGIVMTQNVLIDSFPPGQSGFICQADLLVVNVMGF